MEGIDPVERHRLTERWLVRRGLPHFIEDYSATADVFTRAAPFLTVVFLAEVFFTFDEDREGWAEVLPFLGGLALMLGAAMTVNRLRGRRLLQRPDRVGAPELAVFVLVPPLLPALFGDNHALENTVGAVVANLVVLAGAYVVTSYGLVPMTRWAIGHMFRQLGDLFNLTVRSLPLLLLFTAFLFLNAEIWQVAADFEPPFFWLVIGFIVAAGLAFLLLRLPSEITGLGDFDSWAEVARLAADSPMAGIEPPTGPVEPAPLGRAARVNVALVVVFSQGVQILLVALAIWVVYVGFGLVAVREVTILQWTSVPPEVLARGTLFGHEVVLTGDLLRVSTFIATFAGLQFTVSALTDRAYREEFFEDLSAEVRESLATRALYRSLPGGADD